MLSPITLTPAPIHEGARDLVQVEYEVEVTHETEQKYGRIPLDIDQLFRTPLSDGPSTLYYLETDRFEAEDSGWEKIASTPGIYVLGKRSDGFYEVVVDESYIPLLLHHDFEFRDKAEFEFLIGYDPTRERFNVRFLENAFKAIWSRRSRGLKLCLRSIAPPYLKTALEWAILSCDILESSLLVRRKFTLCLLVLLALSLLDDYSTPSAIQLLEKDEDGVLQVFRNDPADLFKVASAKCQGRKVGLVRRLLILAGGPEDPYQLNFDQASVTLSTRKENWKSLEWSVAHVVLGVSSHSYVVNSCASHQIVAMRQYEFEGWRSLCRIERFRLITVSSLTMQVSHIGSRNF